MAKKINLYIFQEGREQWTVNYSGTESLVNTISTERVILCIIIKEINQKFTIVFLSYDL